MFYLTVPIFLVTFHKGLQRWGSRRSKGSQQSQLSQPWPCCHGPWHFAQEAAEMLTQPKAWRSRSHLLSPSARESQQTPEVGGCCLTSSLSWPALYHLTPKSFLQAAAVGFFCVVFLVVSAPQWILKLLQQEIQAWKYHHEPQAPLLLMDQTLYIGLALSIYCYYTKQNCFF